MLVERFRHVLRWLCCVALTLASIAEGQPVASVPAQHSALMAKGLALFSQKVRPVLLARCFKCHGGEKVESEFDLADRDRLIKGGSLGAAIVPGDADKSLLMALVRHERDPHMPYEEPKLAETERNALRDWINAGAPYDRSLAANANESDWTQKKIEASAREFWSFRPIQSFNVPTVNDRGWIRNPIDSFILAKLEENGLAPSSPAAPIPFLRRLSFDLIGLPPTETETREFESAHSPADVARRVDRWLTSPRFGERWARHWLDLARFAESHGFEHDYDRPSAYHYRDFVIEAFNRDLPFDQFIRWQLAGDEYLPEDRWALAATGFLAAGVHSTQITKNEVEKHRYDELDDMVATSATAFLGLSVGCARCHDHKFDPIPQADYYRFAAAFTTTVRSELDVPLDPANDRRLRAEYERELARRHEQLEAYERSELRRKFQEWDKASTKGFTPEWIALKPTQTQSAGKATMKLLADNVIEFTGVNPDHDVVTIVARSPIDSVASLLIEALPDPSLPKGGPGRASNGNFALTNVQVDFSEQHGKNPSSSTLSAPRATFEQKGLPAAAAIDASPTSGWAIDPRVGERHALAARVEPAGNSSGMRIQIKLSFDNNKGHTIGRLRLSVSSQAQPSLTSVPISQELLASMRKPSASRAAEETNNLIDWFKTRDEEWNKRSTALRRLKATPPKTSEVKMLVATEGRPAIRLHTQGGDFYPSTYFLRRGDPQQKEGVAELAFPQVLRVSASERWQETPPAGSKTSYRRRALAEWMTDVDQGAGALVARVIVNRLWQHHFGKGLVATPSDFGHRGEPPTHPELLEWLAGELIRQQWRLKPIHRLMVTSATYAQAVETDSTKRSRDPENRWRGRRTLRRLEAEAVRDAMLAVSGRLDETMFGPGTLDPNSRRRSIYFTMKRSKMAPMMQVFDQPEPLGGVASRPTTTIAPQALLLMNNPTVRTWSESFADVVSAGGSAVDQQVERAFRRALSRAPTSDELADARSFLAQQTDLYRREKRPEPERQALADFCQTIFCLNEFVYVE